MNEVKVQKKEFDRKVFHFCGVLYILGYAFVPRPIALWIMGILFFVVLILDFFRLFVPKLNSFIMKIFGGVSRQEELSQPSGMPYTFAGAYFTMLFFPEKSIALTALWYQVFGDGMATLVGQKFGQIRIYQKTLAGGTACFLSCLVFSLFLFDYRLAILGSATAALIELLPLPLNDNLSIPIISALVLKYAQF